MCNGIKTFFDGKNKRTENQWNSKNSTYQGPDFIKDGFTFKDVPIKYVFAEKVLGMRIYAIKPSKTFTRSFYFAVLQAGYSVEEEMMIVELNAYFQTLY